MSKTYRYTAYEVQSSEFGQVFSAPTLKAIKATLKDFVDTCAANGQKVTEVPNCKYPVYLVECSVGPNVFTVQPVTRKFTL